MHRRPSVLAAAVGLLFVFSAAATAEVAPAPTGPQPSGTSVYVLDEIDTISSVTGGVSTSLGVMDCSPSCPDMTRDAMGRFVIAAGDALLVLAPSGQFNYNIQAPDGARYFSVVVDGAGNYIVADTGNHQLLRIVPGSNPGSSVTSVIGSWTPVSGSVSEHAFVRIDGTGKYILTVDDQDANDDEPTFRLFTSSSAGPLVPVALTGGAQPASTGGLTFDANGNYVNTDWWGATVYTITPAGASTRLYSNARGYLSTPKGITRDPLSGDFFLVDDDLDALYTLTPDGLVLTQIAQYGTLGVPGSVIVADTVPPHAIDYVLTDSDPKAIVPAGGGNTLTCTPCSGFVSDFAADAQGSFIVASEGALVKVTPGGGSCPHGCTILTPVDGQNFFSVAIDGAGNYIVGDNSNHQLLKVAPGLPGTITGTIPYPVNERNGDAYEDVFVRINASGQYVVAEDNTDDSAISIFVIPPTATSAPPALTLTPGLPLTSTPTTYLGGMTLDATGRYVLTDDDSGQIYVVSPAGALNILFNNPGNVFSELEGIYLDPLTGNFLLTDYGPGNLYTMDQAGTQLTLVQSGFDNPVVAISHPTVLTVSSSTTLPAGTANQPYSATLMAQGGSGSYTWSATGLPSPLTMSPAGVISGVPTAPSVSTNIVATVTDTSTNATAMQTFSLTIAAYVAPPPPAISALNPFSTTAGGPAFTLIVTGTGFAPGAVVKWNGAALTTTYAGPAQLTASVVSGLLTTAGTASVTVVNLGGATSAAATFTINRAAPPLSITSGTPPGGTVNVGYGPFTLTASGGSGGYQWSGSGVPGLSVNGASGVLAGTPSTSGTFTLSVTLTDTANLGSSISQNYTVTISAPALTITTSSLPSGIENQAYSAALAGGGGSGTYTWAISGIAGLTVNASTGAIGGSPTAGGNLTVTVTLSDALNPGAAPATRQYGVNIAFVPLTITAPGALGEFAPNAAISRTFAATGGNPAFTWSATGIPSTLTLNPATGQISGNAPTSPGNYSFALKVSDTETPVASNSITVSFSVLGITTSTTLPSGTTSTAYSLNFIAAGGTPPYTFSSPGVPQGLTLSSSGFLSGTPANPTTSSFQVLVTDASGITPVAGTFSLTVGTGVQPIQVTGTALPDGTLTASYSQPLEAQNGQPPYNWTVLGGSLPAGLMLSSAGTISGTPTATGTATFTARATDSAGGFASGVFSVNVDPSALQITAAALPTGMAGVPFGAQPINATGGFPPYTFALTQGSLPSPLTFSNGQINSGVPAAAGTSDFTVTVTDAIGSTASGSFTLVVEPNHPDLILSRGSVSFAIVTGTATVPPAANVTVGSSAAASLGYNVLVNPSAPWLDVTPNGSTPETVVIGLDPASAPMLGVGNYQTTVTVACLPFSGCSGSHNIAVSLTVTAPAPQLSLGRNVIAFSATGNSSQTMAQPLNLHNSGGGVVTIQSVTAADSWVKFDPATIPPPPVPLAAGQTLQVGVFADTTVPSGPGYYQSTITVTTDAGSATVPVTLLIAPNGTMTLGPAGSQFNTVAGIAPGLPDGSFFVNVSGSSTVNWTAAILPPAPTWLTLNTPSGSSTSGSPGTVTFSVNGASAGLTAQPYYATIEVTVPGGGVADPVQDYQVVLNVAAAGNILAANPDPQGLIFISTGAGTLPPQVVTVGSSSAGVSYSAQTDGSSWLAVSPASGMTSSTSAAQSNISVNTTGLARGVYHGGVNYAIAGWVRTVNVTLVVADTAATPAISGITGKAVPPGCTPTQIIPTQTGLGNNFSLPTSWPTPLEITVNDDCGNPITSGQVVATFSNGDPPLVLPVVGGSAGVYLGTWTPRATASQATISAQATAQGFKPASVQITGQVTRNGAPVLNPGGTLNAFVPVVGSPLAPGMIVQIYGSNLASQVAVSSTIPLTTSLNNTSVIIGGIEAPLYFVSPGQINAQVPFELKSGSSYEVIVNANGALSTSIPIQLAGNAPGIAAFPSGGIIAQHGDGSLVTDASPAAPGEYIVFYVSGMGQTNNPVATGAASPGSPNLAEPTDGPTLTLNGANVPVAFAGLTPTLVGLYQVNFQVPANAPNGDLQLVLTQTGGQSNTTVLPVHNWP